MYVQLSARMLDASSYSAGTRCANPYTHTNRINLLSGVCRRVPF
jgi:hypothetical protein